MATVIVRGIDESVHRRLKIRAAEHGRSMEAELRDLIHREYRQEHPGGGLGTRIHETAAEFGGFELELPERSELATGVDFSS